MTGGSEERFLLVLTGNSAASSLKDGLIGDGVDLRK
jgi:hypothetical protein